MSRLVFVLMLLVLAACQPQQGSNQNDAGLTAATDASELEPAALSYELLDSDFEPFRSDFNHSSGGLRLVFLVGPTCGICLRGMAELQESLNAELSDSRLQTFVVHLPVLGAEESDVLPAAQLLAHGNVHHYWDPEGRLGLRYTETFDTNVYAWDMWFVYDTRVPWAAGTPPPMPDFWMHQLGTLPDEKYLDAEVFAQAVRTRLQKIESLDSQAGPEVSIVGVRIEDVMQPRGVGVQNDLIGRGGYAHLKRLNGLVMSGRTEWHGQAQALRMELTRNSLDRNVGTSQIRFDGKKLVRTGIPESLPLDLENALFSTLSLGGPFLEWPQQGHTLDDDMGAEQLADGLAWVIRRTHHRGSRWQHFINLRSGLEVRRDMLNADDQILYTIGFGDFRNARGFSHEPATYQLGRQRFELTGLPVPHLIEYRNASGELLARDVLDTVTVSMDPVAR